MDAILTFLFVLSAIGSLIVVVYFYEVRWPTRPSIHVLPYVFLLLSTVCSVSLFGLTSAFLISVTYFALVLSLHLLVRFYVMRKKTK